MRRRIVGIILLGWLSVGALPAWSATRTWTGAIDTDWFTAGNWQDGGGAPGIPLAGDTVTVNSGAILLTNATPLLAAFAISGATVTFTNWTTALSAADVTVHNGASFTLPPAFTESQMSNRVWVICDQFTLHAGATILADASGYAQANGPGRGLNCPANGGSGGGGYGGKGGDGSRGGITGGEPYGMTNAPLDPGSGGGFISGGVTYPGGHGGGAIRIEAAGRVMIDGTVSANGGNGVLSGFYNAGGGGSGGAIYITCHAFGGGAGGILQADGGDGGSGNWTETGGGGGGGRIAIDYTIPDGAPGVRISANHGSGRRMVSLDAPTRLPTPEMGTLWFPAPLLINTILTQWSGVLSWLNGYVVFQSSHQWIPSELRELTGSRLGVPAGHELRLDQDLVISGGGLRVSEHALLIAAGHLRLTNGATIMIHSGATNSVAPQPYGARMEVAGELTVASNSWIYPYCHPIDGGAPFFRIGKLTILEGGGIDADTRGYTQTRGPGRGGNCPANGGSGGGGYGGKGGLGSKAAAFGGLPYGCPNAPIKPGSGGGYLSGSITWPGGHGGGKVWLDVTGNLILDGTISANGGNGGLAGFYNTGGGGSGGAIYITCRSLRGGPNGILRADGGQGGDGTWAETAGGGGGGRIAVWQPIPEPRRQRYLNGETGHIIRTEEFPETFRGTVSVANGPGHTDPPDPNGAYPGTAFTFFAHRGTVMQIR